MRKKSFLDGHSGKRARPMCKMTAEGRTNFRLVSLKFHHEKPKGREEEPKSVSTDNRHFEGSIKF